MTSKLIKAFVHLSIFFAFSLTPVGANISNTKKLDRAEVEAWANNYYGTAISEKRNAAITVAIVQDGEVLFQKGYGHQDYGKNTPANAVTSGFTVGSITKTFTATLVAQLVDRGLIGSLDDPANKYLKRVQLPGRRGAKVTISHLLNHRAGFSDIDFGFLTSTIQDIEIPLTSKEIMRFMPDIVMEPGGRAVYSNWSFSLLGFIVEDITGERFDTYMKKNIFDPLGMSHTSLIYGALPANQSKQYLFTKSGDAVSKEPVMAHPWISPAGTIVSTAADMALYMNAHIYEGRAGGYPLLSPEMFKALHEESYRNGPISIGFSHTFWTNKVLGASTIEHGGGTPAFQSMMIMIPELKIGFFASALQSGLVPWEEYSKEELVGNVAVKDPMGGYELRESFVERFFPQEVSFPIGPKTNIEKLVGTYLSTRRAFNTVEALSTGFNPSSVLTVSITDTGDAILMNGNGPFKDIGNGIFANMSKNTKWATPYAIDHFNPKHISFSLTEDGTVIDFVAGLGDQVWQSTSSIFNPQTMTKWFMVLGLFAVSGLLIFLWPTEQRFTNRANLIAFVLAIAVIAIPYSIVGGFKQGDDLVTQMGVGDAGRLWVMAIASNMILISGLLMLWQCLVTFREGSTNSVTSWVQIGRKIHLSLLTLVALLFIPALAEFNLIGFNIPG